jgi:hypothetical protein
MKRTLIACAAITLGASVVPAASPAVDKAIKTIEAVAADPARLKLFCALDDVIEAEEEKAEAAKADPAKEDPAVEKQIEDILAQLGPDFTAAWEAGGDLDDKSTDGAEFAAAVEALAAKCQ